MDSGLPTSGLAPSGQSWGGHSWHLPYSLFRGETVPIFWFRNLLLRDCQHCLSFFELKYCLHLLVSSLTRVTTVLYCVKSPNIIEVPGSDEQLYIKYMSNINYNTYMAGLHSMQSNIWSFSIHQMYSQTSNRRFFKHLFFCRTSLEQPRNQLLTL